MAHAHSKAFAEVQDVIDRDIIRTDAQTVKTMQYILAAWNTQLSPIPTSVGKSLNPMVEDLKWPPSAQYLENITDIIPS